MKQARAGAGLLFNMGSIGVGRVNTNDIAGLAEELKKEFSAHDLARLANLITTSSPVAKYTPAEFDEIIQRLQGEAARRGFSDKSIEAARLVMVMGASIPEAADQVALSRQAVAQLMARIERRLAQLPEGWVKVTAWYPGSVAAELGRISEKIKERPDQPCSFTVIYAGK